MSDTVIGMSKSSQVITDLAVSREAARVTAQDALDRRNSTRHKQMVVADILIEIDRQGLGLTAKEKAIVIVDAIERAS